MIGCHTSRRSHTVGVSHVARAGSSRFDWRAYHTQRYGLGTREVRKIEHESQSCCDRHFMSIFEAMLPAVMIWGGVVDEGRVIAIIIFRDNNLGVVCF